MVDDRIKLARQFAAALPFCRSLSMSVEEIGPGKACLTMPYDKRIVGDKKTGVVHGGAVLALLDSCAGTAVFIHPDGAGPVATLDLRVDYMRSAEPQKTIHAEAECYHTTRSVAFIRAKAHDGNPNDPVAVATGAFTFKKREVETA